MNERIRELAEQATKYAFEWAEGDSKINPKITPDKWLKAYQEKFAELIVKECVEQASISNGHGNNQWDKALTFAADNIKKHFGVEQ